MVEVTRLPDATLITVRCSAAVFDLVGLPGGLAFPREANRFATVETTKILWVGPDDWMIVDERDEAPDLLAELESAFAGYDAAVIDVSGNRARFRVSGSDARALMNRACALDLDPPHFAAGHCAGTLVARAQAFVMQIDDAPSYELLVRRSFAPYLADWLVTAAQGLRFSTDAQLFPGSAATRPHPA